MWRLLVASAIPAVCQDSPGGEARTEDRSQSEELADGNLFGSISQVVL